MNIPVGWAAQRLLQYTQGISGQASPIGGSGGLGSVGGSGGLGGLGTDFSRVFQAAQAMAQDAAVQGVGEPGLGGALPFPAPAASLGPSFGDTMRRALSEVSDAQDNAQQQMHAFMRGEPVELHQVMAATEEAGIALEMLIEVRNKFTEAYRTVINMQS